ncbi:MAG TPA: tRNA dihydrouridine synthase DusB [Firmicutes bacterium]|nr:tRNA dihydrouridine synthase DusB [Bacillota bacterium]
MLIGTVKLESPVIPAPMAGVTDLPFRRILKAMGAGLVCSEMVSAQALVYGNARTLDLLQVSREERPISLQLFGSNPETLAKAVRILQDYPIDLIDLNMGCPVPKVVKNGEGAALLRDLPRAAAIIQAVVAAAGCPVTVKMRAGWERGQEVAPELAILAEQAGAAAVAVHSRYRADFYSGEADWNIIKRVKAAVKIPVIGNGDVTSPADALAMMEQTGCDGVMIGRAVMGNPWLIKQVTAVLRGVPVPPPPTHKERFALMKEHFRAQIKFSGEKRGILEMRKHLSWYMKGFPGAARFRDLINSAESKEAVLELLRKLEEQPVKGG